MPAGICANCTCGAPVPPSCGATSGCAEFCDPGLMAFLRGPQCDCPCAGRRAYPRCYRVTWTGVQLLVGVKIVHDIGGGYYIINSFTSFTSTQTYVFGGVGADCVVSSTGTPGQGTLNYSLYQADGTNTFTGDGDFEFTAPTLGISPTDCTKFLSGCAMETPTAIPVGTDDSASATQVIDRCGGGTYVPNILTTSGGGVSWIEAGSAGVVTIEPVCTDCDGAPCDGGSTDPVSTCAGSLTLDFTQWDGMTNVAYVVPMGFGADVWSGSGNGSSSATIAPITSSTAFSKCCPALDPHDCTDCPVGGTNSEIGETGLPGSGGCEECWRLTITVGGGVAVYDCQGPCPTTSNLNLISFSGFPDDTQPGDITISFGSDCP